MLKWVMTHRDAAEVFGISERTWSRWRYQRGLNQHLRAHGCLDSEGNLHAYREDLQEAVREWKCSVGQCS